MTSDRRHVIVVGGGVAGLSAAVALADAGARVTVLEGRAALGGRARSFTDPATGEVVDNGQHLFLAGYPATRRFLRRLGTEQRILFQERLRVTFVEPGGRRAVLDCPPLPAPWHLLAGMTGLASLSLQERMALRAVAQEVQSIARHGNGAVDLDGESVEGWLTRLGQSAHSRQVFWDPLAVATLNEDPRRASALGWVAVLRGLLCAPWPAARLGICCVGLSDLYAEPARRVIEENGGEVLLSSPVARLEAHDDRVEAVRLANGTGLAADAVVSALPPAALTRILCASAPADEALLDAASRFTTVPILSVNLWLDRPLTEELFVGLIGTRIQWFFNKPAILARAGPSAGLRTGLKANYLSLIMSAAQPWVHLSNEALVEIAMEDLRLCFPGPMRTARLIRSQVIREREATVSLRVGSQRYRPGAVTALENLFLAGDWTDTGLPATIESAAASGEKAARAALGKLRLLEPGPVVK